MVEFSSSKFLPSENKGSAFWVKLVALGFLVWVTYPVWFADYCIGVGVLWVGIAGSLVIKKFKW